MKNWHASEVKPTEWAEAVGLLFAHVPFPEGNGLARRTLDLLKKGQLPAGGLRVVRSPSGVQGAVLAVPAPGKVGLVWPPRTIDGPAAAAIEDALLQDARAWLTGQGIKLCQALLTTSEAEQAHCLVRNQFRRITGLIYLARRLPIERRGPAVRPALSFEPFGAADPELFAATLEATYEETLDFPELNGIRTRDEVLAGHQAQGNFDPSRWWLVREGERACGVLLTSSAAADHSWEVIYMGLVPAARGRRLGRALLEKAGLEAAQAGARRLTLCVDERNQPARKLYQASGFEQVDRREVFLAILQPPR